MIKLPIKITVEYKDRIDKYIADHSVLTRVDAKKLIERRTIEVKEVKVRKPNFSVFPNDVIVINEIIDKEIKALPEDIPIDIIYEDDSIIIVNKPSGMVVHPAPGHSSGTLVNALLYHFKDQLSDLNGSIRPGIVHRIDKDTSGLLVVAKTNEAHRFLAEQLKEHNISRIYYAIVVGMIKDQITHIKLPIGRDQKNRKKMSVTRRNSKDAVTHVYQEYEKNGLTFIRCELETGRTHQIRVHLAYIKNPIYGDHMYGKKVDDYGQRLHAGELRLVHPITKEEMVFKAELPDELKL